jgi:hypothetical protein
MRPVHLLNPELLVALDLLLLLLELLDLRVDAAAAVEVGG